MNRDILTTEKVISSLINDVEVKKLSLSLFLESLIEANMYGSNKWGVYYTSGGNRVRLLVGGLIVQAITRQGIWMALDYQLLQKSKKDLNLLNLSNDWQWDSGRWSKYTRVHSKNGYYIPSKDHLRIWPILRLLHFSYIGQVAKKFPKLRKDSQKKHMPQVLSYLRSTLNQGVPEPIYTDHIDSVSDPLREIQEYQSTPQYRNKPETEREAIIQSRLGQGRFRTDLINYWGGCAVTECKAKEVLIASHIKPWRNSSDKERLDVYNGFLLVPNLDIAFDIGLISFTNNGEIIISNYLIEDDRLILGIHPDMRIIRMDKRHRFYLEYHREQVLKTGKSPKTI